jgi:hypothetical protein
MMARTKAIPTTAYIGIAAALRPMHLLGMATSEARPAGACWLQLTAGNKKLRLPATSVE